MLRSYASDSAEGGHSYRNLILSFSFQYLPVELEQSHLALEQSQRRELVLLL